MSRAALWLHIALCALALGFAWQSAHKEKEKKGGPSAVVLLDAAPGDVVSIGYTWDTGSTKTTVSGGAKNRSAVVELDREIPKKAPPKKKDDHGKDVDAAPEAIANDAPPEHERATLPGGKNLLTAIEALEPLKTKRTLGVVDDARLEAMGLSGLKKPLRTLTITTKKKTLELELGEASYGAQGRYARVKGDNVVHLIDAAIASGLEGGVDTLLEKRLLTTDLENITGFTVRSADKNGAWLHVDKDQPTTRFFAKRDDPTSKDEPAGKLMTTLRNLRGNKLFDAAAKPEALGSVVVSFVVDTVFGAVTVDIVERTDGEAEARVARVGRWVYELTPTQTKELTDDLGAL